MKIKVYNQTAELVHDLELSDKVFGVKSNAELLHQAVVTQMGNERQVLADTKDRSEVRGGGKKPWKQKGTGRARVGSSRSPIWTGGGVTFGPTSDRNFSKKINKKMKQKAILMALSDKLASGTLVVLDSLNLEEFKTKKFNEILTAVENKILNSDRRNILVINDTKDDKVKYSARNLKGTEIINLENINIVELLKYKNLLLTETAVKTLEERYK
ncbi:MAG: 50S ribosomal protein L4 [Candidatus Falkowbacteria bacterium]